MTNMEGIKPLVGGISGGSPLVPKASGTPGEAPFAGVFKGLVHETGDLSAKAEHAVAGLLRGTGMDVHEAMIATQKADIAF